MERTCGSTGASNDPWPRLPSGVMFTGIVTARGSVAQIAASRGGKHLTLQIGALAAPIEVGDSIAVNGVCLTVVALTDETIEVDVVAETLRRSNLGTLEVGDEVNLELPLPATGRFDGHIVQGHVDATATMASATPEGDSVLFEFSVAHDLTRYIVEKGSIAVDGVSLTVASVKDDGFVVALIPHTLEITTLGLRQPGDQVNLEFDVIAKYVERLLGSRA